MNILPFVERSFSSMAECLAYIESNFPQETISIQAREVGAGTSFTHQAPKYFYRGESKVYSSTTSTMHRVKNAFSKNIKEEIESIVLHVDTQLQDWLGIDPMLSAGYLQHYGFPTELLDISSDLKTASFFASYEDLTQKTQEGCICVFDMALVHNQSIIIDLSQHEYALRPRLQSGYTFFHNHYTNIKSTECISQLGLHWLYYTTTKEEKADYFDALKYLPNNLDDVTAGFIYMCLLQVPFKVSDRAADFIVNERPIPTVPLVIDSRTGEARTFSQAGIRFDENIARYNLYRVLSNQFPDTWDNQRGFNPYL